MLLDAIADETNGPMDLVKEIAKRCDEPGLLAELAALLIAEASVVVPLPRDSSLVSDFERQDAFQMVVGRVLHALARNKGLNLQILYYQTEEQQVILGRGVVLNIDDSDAGGVFPGSMVSPYAQTVTVGEDHRLALSAGQWPDGHSSSRRVSTGRIGHWPEGNAPR